MDLRNEKNIFKKSRHGFKNGYCHCERNKMERSNPSINNL